MENLTDAPTYGSKRWALRMVRELKTLKRREEDLQVDMARRLWALHMATTPEVPRLPWWVRWGHKSISDLDRALGIAPKLGQRLRRIYWKFAIDLGLGEEVAADVLRLGLSKAVLLSQHGRVTPESAASWIARAKDLTLAELRAALGQAMGSPGPE